MADRKAVVKNADMSEGISYLLNGLLTIMFRYAIRCN